MQILYVQIIANSSYSTQNEIKSLSVSVLKIGFAKLSKYLRWKYFNGLLR